MVKTVRLDELIAFSNSLAHDLMRPYERVFGEKTKNIKRTSEDIANIAGRLEISIKNAWGSLDKATSEQGLRLTQTIKETARQLTGQEIDSNYTESERFHETAIDVSNKIILAIRKYVPKLYKVLKTDLAALNSALSKLEASINSLGIALDESPGKVLQSLESEIKIIQQKNHVIKGLQKQDEEIKRSIQKSSKTERSLLLEQNALLSGEQFRKLQQYEEALNSKSAEIDQLLQPLTKPLRKFERTLSDNDSTVDRNILAKLMEAPKETISSYDAQLINRLFGSLEDALNNGKLEIEDRKRRRAQEVIQAINRGELEKLRTAYLLLQNDAQTAKESLAAHGLLEKNERLKQLLSETRSQGEQLKLTQRENAKKIEELTRVVSKQKALIESRIAKLSGQQISLDA